MADYTIHGMLAVVALVLVVSMFSGINSISNNRQSTGDESDIAGLASAGIQVQKSPSVVNRRICVSGTVMQMIYDDDSIVPVYCRRGCEQVDSYFAKCR